MEPLPSNSTTRFYLDSLLTPLAPWLSKDDVTDIFINVPGEIWIERLGGKIERHVDAALTERLLVRLARQIAAYGSQGISRAAPLLAASLPDGSRVQVIAPPATRGNHVFAIRRHVKGNFSLSDWRDSDAFSGLSKGAISIDRERVWQRVGEHEAAAALLDAVRTRRNIIISGGTSSGKTTFLNALLAEIPLGERLLTIEDTEELRINHPNAVGLIAARGPMAEADVTAEDLLIAALRMRPDRIILGELRGAEAFTFLRAVNTGHPGSMTTIHADTPQRAIEQLALLVLQTGSRLSRDDVRHYVRESIDVFVQLDRRDGKRRVSEVMIAE
ncbi:P-type DNA transfer ATPase VirB11 [Erythrobacter sp. SAORIC-644]|uniref:P-type DNA transfer ATPase VirB11 n=1 Tax=Erythrobacter sp. SAORIC-644 TaxID=1869314 RepID=UPI000C9F3B00|nr:P-type DNA transfer ATPase VirB11 [Erythrobacter sp. SAORIC-644]PNQ76346.1 P-type DNA transfer ATPase VirB11 [Erythrobacter sp. SAORIC-644]